MAIALASFALRAQALEPRRALVMTAHASEGKRDAAVEREVRRSLAELELVELLPPAPLDLEAVQLAIDCPEESARCLAEVAQRMDARVLIVAAVERSAGTVALRLLHFDAEAGDAPRNAVREQEGDEVDRALLDAVPDMLRELLGVAPKPAEVTAKVVEEPAPPEQQPTPAPAALELRDRAPGDGRGVPLGPVLLGSGGLGAIAAGLVVGALMQDTQERYAARTIDTQAQADAAEDERELGRRQALAANVLLGAGAAAVVAAGIWFALDAGGGDDEPPARAALVPVIGPGALGASLFGTWEASR